MEYLPRILDKQLERALQSAGFVLIEGVRGCGKTVTAQRQAQETVFLATNTELQALARDFPELALQGKRPLLVDEWQISPNLWNMAKQIVDQTQQLGAFIFTGSALPPNEASRHTGAARAQKIKMRTLTTFESQRAPGTVSLAKLLAGEAIEYPLRSNGEYGLPTLVENLVRGGWPAYRKLSAENALANHRSYISDALNYDFATITGPANPQTAKAVLHGLARTIGQRPKIAAYSQDLVTGRLLSPETAQTYRSKLTSLFLVENVEPWLPQLRSKYTLIRSLNHYFADPALAAAALGATPTRLMRDLNTLGFLFENLVLRDLLVYAESQLASVKNYRDESGLEIDVIVEDANANWGAIEIKLGFSAIEGAAANLLRLKSQVDSASHGEPAFLAIITDSQTSYTRRDGVHVIALSDFGP